MGESKEELIGTHNQLVKQLHRLDALKNGKRMEKGVFHGRSKCFVVILIVEPLSHVVLFRGGGGSSSAEPCRQAATKLMTSSSKVQWMKMVCMDALESRLGHLRPNYLQVSFAVTPSLICHHTHLDMHFLGVSKSLASTGLVRFGGPN